MKRSPTIEERFLAKVDRSGECWLWTAATDPRGYGRFDTGGRGESSLAHRVAYRLFKGDIAAGLFVCHSCDTPRCVNPAHLWLGTTTDNQRDSRAKGRNPTWRMTRCRKGHEYQPGTFTWRKKGQGKFRRCLLCERPLRNAWMKAQRRAP